MPSRAFTLATVLGADGNLNAQDVSGLAAVASTGSFSDVINKPTTTSGYGITDSSPTITSLVYAGNDLATDTTTPLAVTIIGTNFEASSNIYIDTISAVNACTSLQYSGTTQITFTPPAKSAASYNVWLVGPSGKIAVLANGILYSGTPSWAGVATSYTTETNVVSIQLTAASTDTPVTYSLVSGTLPSGVTLSSTGLISGTAAITATTTYSSLVIRATDQQNQDANLTVSLTVTYIKPVTRSLRFNSADSAYLNRTPSVAGNRKTWTWSAWVKRSSLSVSNSMLFGCGDSYISFDGDSLEVNLRTAATNYFGISTAKYRDLSAWYHVVVSVDTTQSTAADRLKMWINSQQITVFDFNTYINISQNYDTGINQTAAHNIGRYTAGSDYYNGYMAEVNFIDGQQLTPTSFGETNPQTGVWRPVTYTGSYGTNGFYLDFSDNSAATASTLGKDYSGNNNNWTPNNFSVASGAGNDSLVDSPTSYGTDTGLGGEVRGNYCTWNRLAADSSAIIANGNLDVATTIAGFGQARGTIGVSSGKWYWEVTQTSTGANLIAGIVDSPTGPDKHPGQTSSSYGYYGSGGTKLNNGSASSYGASFGVGDVIGVALDMDAGTLVFYKNNASQGTAFTGLSGTFFPAASDDTGGGSLTFVGNFGQRPFAYSAPSGFKALCTQNLPTPAIGATTATQAGKYFNTVLYTGNGGTLSVTGTGFQPDFVWLKGRSVAYQHGLFDAVRGANKMISTDSASAEGTFSTTLTSFDSDGFIIGSNGTFNTNTSTFASWNWRANGAGSSNTAGSITSTVSANTTSGFSIVTYTGTGAVATVGHGLGVKPAFILTKSRNNVEGWGGYHVSLGATKGIFLNSTDAAYTANNYWNNTEPTSSVFTVYLNLTNTSGYTYVAYCFAPIAGYSAFGSYTGNGSTDGPFVYTGFRPAYVLAKRTDGTSVDWVWWVQDNKRGPYNATAGLLKPNSSDAENSSALMDFVSNGFKLRNASGSINANGSTYIYAAFAETPFKYSLAR